MKSLIGSWLILAGVLVTVGCVGLERARPTLPEKYSVVREQLIVQSDFPLAAHHRLIEELTARRLDLSWRLNLPLCDEPIYVYLFEDADRFHEFIERHHADFPQRRAFFIETDTRLVVYAHWGDRVAEDLRHEVAHAYLHSAVPNLPLWLDEGLAEHYEVPRGQNINRQHLDRLRARLQKGDFRVDLTRLEGLDSSFDMSQDDYAESWVWVHFLLEGPAGPDAVLPNYLADLRHAGSAEPLSDRLAPTLERYEQDLVTHIRSLAGRER